MLQHIEERIDNTKANVRQAAKEVKKVTICFFYQSNDCHWRRLIVCVCVDRLSKVKDVHANGLGALRLVC